MTFFVRAAVALIGSIVLGASSCAAAASEPSARDLMEKNFFVSKLSAVKTSGTMVLINDKGQTRERQNTSYSVLEANGIDSKILVKFSYPTDIKGTAFLEIEHSDADDDQWIYLPALGKSRRLVANNKKDSFVGSDFSYGDISLPKVDLYEHRLLDSETVGGQDCYKIESTPRTEATRTNSGYNRKITWVRKDNFLETRVEYYDLSGRLFKTQVVTGAKLIEPERQRWLALRREMTNEQTGHRTVLTFDQIDASPSVPEDLFTTRYLERE